MNNSTQGALKPQIMRIYTQRDLSGRLRWYYRCRECVNSMNLERNIHARGCVLHWEWALDDANWHLETYH
jgi:hypothetical protein